MQDTAGEVKVCSFVTFSCGLLHMDEQMLNVSLEPIYNSSVLEDLPNTMDNRDE